MSDRSASLVTMNCASKYGAPQFSDSGEAEFVDHGDRLVSQSSSLVLVRHKADNSFGQCDYVIGWYQDSIYTVLDHFAWTTAAVEAHYRKAASHGFEQRH